PFSFLCMLARPPCSTPFPYTTLFRSPSCAATLRLSQSGLSGSQGSPVVKPALSELSQGIGVREGSRPRPMPGWRSSRGSRTLSRSEEHTSELQSREKLVCRLLLEKKK